MNQSKQSHWLAFCLALALVVGIVVFGIDWNKGASIEAPTIPTETTMETEGTEETEATETVEIVEVTKATEVEVTECTECTEIIETIEVTETEAIETTEYTAPTEIILPKHDVYYDMNVRGAYGRLIIANIGIDVAVFQSPVGCECNQGIVNAQDSALWMDNTSMGETQPFIGDHNNQEFATLSEAIPYETYAYVDRGEIGEAYMCVANFIGVNTGYQVLDDEGNDVMYLNEGGIMMYTCTDEKPYIVITYWQPV